MVHKMRARVDKILGFIRRQKHNYHVGVARSSANSFLTGLTNQYSAIYAVGLGADSVQLGSLSSVGSAISTLISTPVGWLVDRLGIRPFFLLAIVISAGGVLLYAVARDWRVLIAAAILASISGRLSGTSSSVICADSVQNRDRVTAQNLCGTLSSIASVISPLVAAYLVTAFGGMNPEGIRPLYYLQFVGYGLVFLLVAVQLREPRQKQPGEAQVSLGFMADFRRLFEGRPVLRRWIVISALTSLPMAMFWPFTQLYAHEIKGADQFLLGVMATATVVARLVFGIPLGRLADKIGRKRVIYLLTPLWYVSNLLLAFSTGPITLILYAALQTFYTISSGVTSAMTMELVPVEQQGRWSGLLGLFAGLLTIPAPIIGGLIWRELGPVYVFLIPIALDLLLRVPLLSTIPETLRGPSPGEMKAG
jgi:MFS family permease